MNFYIKEWPDNTASLITEGGLVVWFFSSVEEAEEEAVHGDEITVAEKSVTPGKGPGIKSVAWKSPCHIRLTADARNRRMKSFG